MLFEAQDAIVVVLFTSATAPAVLVLKFHVLVCGAVASGTSADPAAVPPSK